MRMYHQAHVNFKDHCYLRFLWWPGGNTLLSPAHYYMKVHVFVATSSPTCALYALKETGKDHTSLYLEEAVQSVMENFYMYNKSVMEISSTISHGERCFGQKKQQRCRLSLLK